jgi:hypothetical protein
MERLREEISTCSGCGEIDGCVCEPEVKIKVTTVEIRDCIKTAEPSGRIVNDYGRGVRDALQWILGESDHPYGEQP